MSVQIESAPFAREIKTLLKKYYLQSQATDADDEKQRGFINGFMYAGLISGIINKTSLEQLISTVHQEVFGMTLSQKHYDRMMNADDTSFFDIPTIIRQPFRK